MFGSHTLFTIQSFFLGGGGIIAVSVRSKNQGSSVFFREQHTKGLLTKFRDV